jgi:hypothetical protein
MLGAGTVINPIIKIITVVVVLGAVYLFIVKPVLDTTNNAFEEFGGAFDNLPSDIQDRVDDAIDDVPDSDEGQFGRCIRAAIPNQHQVDRCVERFTG